MSKFPEQASFSQTPPYFCSLFCSTCKKYHSISQHEAIPACQRLMQWLEQHQRIDYLSNTPGNPAYSTESLFGAARGKMFGALVGVDPEGQEKTLYAFSGQYNGYWSIPGWAPPLFDEDEWRTLHDPLEHQIKELSRHIAVCHAPETRAALCQQRKGLSRYLMKKLHALYLLPNFRGEQKHLDQFFTDSRIPTGTGDCCAPKLLASAVVQKIRPLALAEFFWGKSNRSASKHHKKFYPPCQEKCHPILGFMLCGADAPCNINFLEIEGKRN